MVDHLLPFSFGERERERERTASIYLKFRQTRKELKRITFSEKKNFHVFTTQMVVDQRSL